MCGEGAVTDRTCQKWFVKFHVGDFSLDNAPWLGRPVEVDNDQIETLIESSQHYSTQRIADILKMSKSIKLLMKMKKNVSFILWKKLNGLPGQPNSLLTKHIQNLICTRHCSKYFIKVYCLSPEQRPVL